ncbi:E3 ubiquitin-protein ligase RNF103-like isoform X2 [Bacillus rossius redtenbacheri]
MRSFWIQLTLLLVYLIIVFLISRILELVPWYKNGSALVQAVDPFTLSVQQLKQLLESRGVSEIGYVEKKDLVDLVKESAPVSQGEVQGLEAPRPTPATAHFSGALHFYEQVEDTKDSVWLVQVLRRGRALLDDAGWRSVRAQVAPFAIRTGVFDCRLDMRLCKSKGWEESLLVLAMPKGTRSKDKVILKTFSSKKPESVVGWVRAELSVRVHKVAGVEEARCGWLGQCAAQENSTAPGPGRDARDVRVLLLTHMLHPPLFLAALSIRFTGRVRFGMLAVRRGRLAAVRRRLGLPELGRAPAYLVVTPEKSVVYGRRRLEHFNFHSMNVFLKAVQPEMNDVFLCSLVVTNLLAILQTCQVWECLWWKHVAQCLWIMFSYNFWFFISWLLLLATYKFSVVSAAAELGLSLVHRASLSELGSLVRSDCLALMHHPYIFFTTFAVFAFVAALVLNRAWPVERGAGVRWTGVLPAGSRWISRYLFRPMGGISAPVSSNDHVREELEWLIERLAVPNLWLQPVVPHGYVKGLPAWRFRGWDACRGDSPAVLERLMDARDPADVLCRGRGTPRAGPDEAGSTPSGSDVSEDSGDEGAVAPAGMRPTAECAVCLEQYARGAWLCGLPCGHSYHQDCIMAWLTRDNHNCPVCRWPAYKQKHPRVE